MMNPAQLKIEQITIIPQSVQNSQSHLFELQFNFSGIFDAGVGSSCQIYSLA
jgi:hypothetical protein